MNYSTSSSEFEGEDEVSLGDLFYKFIPYWPYFLLLVLISMSGAWLYVRYKLPVYQTTATLLIKDDKSSTPASELQDAFDMFGAKKNLENEVEVLQSKTLMKEVVENLHLYAPIYIKGRVIHQSGYVRSPVVVEAKYPDSLQPVKEVHFTFNALAGNVVIQDTAYPLNQWESTSYGRTTFYSKSKLSSFAHI